MCGASCVPAELQLLFPSPRVGHICLFLQNYLPMAYAISCLLFCGCFISWSIFREGLIQKSFGDLGRLYKLGSRCWCFQRTLVGMWESRFAKNHVGCPTQPLQCLIVWYNVGMQNTIPVSGRYISDVITGVGVTHRYFVCSEGPWLSGLIPDACLALPRCSNWFFHSLIQLHVSLRI